ncbi:MAG: ABC transporter, permease protein (cluster 3, basic aa/glutamine/opines) [uncultured Rubrobacteraceae bacterium]|uniref:ABC transporter, permease protein (Cluster 3, basic aa/glutamine/opines) n=1 Tax=uncultured Rubrobacteraceae bacterium TaxID=349277 RepID=A0A6J4PT56_9ACTN|nr:MAG: ABC transporter, permease protein (cluster 3, basic aa/glutamine/opines) [uncultured Rubrobacteraceae bacterium]
MPFESPVEFDPSLFNLRNIRETYLDFPLVVENIDTILQALLVTILLALLAEILGIVLGLVLALMKIGRSKLLSAPAQVYIDVFRGTPLLIQIIFIYFATPNVGIRIESLFFAGLVALTLNSAAYVAEIFRSGIQSIDRGQMEAGRASGLTYAQTMRHIIVPQAFRRVIPPLTNEFVMLIKDTSIVSVIGLEELLRSARVLQSATSSGTPLVAAALFYLAICLPLIYLANGLERRLNRRTA